MKKSKQRKLILIFVALIIIIAGSVGGFYAVKRHQQEKNYLQAEKYFEQKEYPAAKELFIQLGSYRDSTEWVSKCDIQPELDSADDLMEQRQYEKAREIYQKYKLEENSNECTYQLAISYADSKKYKEALQEFGMISTYKDSADQAQTLLYEYGLSLYDKRMYTDAQLCFQEAGHYKRAPYLAENCNLGIKYEKCDIENYDYDGNDPVHLYAYAEDQLVSFFYQTWYDVNGNELVINKDSINGIAYQVTSIDTNGAYPAFEFTFADDTTKHRICRLSPVADKEVLNFMEDISFDDITYYEYKGEKQKKILAANAEWLSQLEKEAEEQRLMMFKESVKNPCKNNILDYFNKEGKDKMEQTITAFNSWMISNFKATISNQICYIECDISRTWSFGLNKRHITAQYLIDNAGNIQRTSISYQ